MSVITHPTVITSVLELVLNCLRGDGAVIITDGPQTDSSWDGIMSRMTPDVWEIMGRRAGVSVTVLDLRDHEWITARGSKEGGIVERRELPGDPRGSTVCDLGLMSEFVDHQPSRHGYYGADYDKRETNAAHSNNHHR